MKKLVLMLLIVLSMNSVYSEIISQSEITEVVNFFIQLKNENNTISSINELSSIYDSSLIGYVYNLSPEGFIICSNKKEATPIMGYSFHNNFGSLDANRNLALKMVKNDLSNESIFINDQSNIYERKEENEELWHNYITKNIAYFNNIRESNNVPPLLTTSWEGGDFLHWETGELVNRPGNNLCPLDADSIAFYNPDDPTTERRSAAGCVTTALSQIINYHKTLGYNEVWFTEDDAYTRKSSHSVNDISIPDDSEYLDFPNFDELNDKFQLIKQKYTVEGVRLQDNGDYDLQAALQFGVGIKQKMSYSFKGSSSSLINLTDFGLSHYRVWNYGEYNYDFKKKILKQHLDLNYPLYALIRTTYKGDPAHGGHAVIIDGYDIEDFFHVIFGRDGMHDAYYNLVLFDNGNNNTYNDSLYWSTFKVEGIYPQTEYSVESRTIRGNVSLMDNDFDPEMNVVNIYIENGLENKKIIPEEDGSFETEIVVRTLPEIENYETSIKITAYGFEPYKEIVDLEYYTNNPYYIGANLQIDRDIEIHQINSENYEQINNIIKNAEENDIILFGPEEFNFDFNIEVYNKNLTFQGISNYTVLKFSTYGDEYKQIYLRNSRSTLKNLNVKRSIPDAIESNKSIIRVLSDAKAKFYNLKFEDVGYCIFFRSKYLSLSNCRFYNNPDHNGEGVFPLINSQNGSIKVRSSFFEMNSRMIGKHSSNGKISFDNCKFKYNTTSGEFLSGRVDLNKSLFANNQGRITNDSEMEINKCTFVDNISNNNLFDNSGSIMNSIIWSNNCSGNVFGNYDLIVDYSVLQEYHYGDNNIYKDPQLSEYYIPKWTSSFKSPCIDTGDPNLEFDNDNTRADRGCYSHSHEDGYYFNKILGIYQGSTYYNWICFPVIDAKLNDANTISTVLGESGLLATRPKNLKFLKWKQWPDENDIHDSQMEYDGSWNFQDYEVDYTRGFILELEDGVRDFPYHLSGIQAPENTEISLKPGWNWIGYFLEESMTPDEALKPVWDQIDAYQHHDFSGNYNQNQDTWLGLRGKNPTFNYGDMVKVHSLEETTFQWGGENGNITPMRSLKEPKLFSYEEHPSYTPVYLEMESMPRIHQEIAIMVDGVCKGASVVEADTVQIRAYISDINPNEEHQIEFVVMEEGGREVLMYKDYSILDNKSGILEDKKLKFNSLQDYYFISLDKKTTSVENEIPKLELKENFPNPFKLSGSNRDEGTMISFSLPNSQKVDLSIFNIKGQKVKTLINEEKSGGNHQILWKGLNNENKPVSTGVYFYRLKTDKKVINKKMLLIK